jgi:predicted nucleotide-binding protein
MGSYFVGGRWSRPMFNARPFAIQFTRHGRDEDGRNEVALFLRKIGLEDTVLHQRPNRGRHLHTKFQEEAEGASFAVILMTPDDDGGLVGEPQQRRARQNVVFELGFFIGKLETPHVAAFIGPGVEKPSDFDGICWIEFGRAPKWKIELARELKEAGVPFDSDKILHA